jgi:hypothetical protein
MKSNYQDRIVTFVRAIYIGPSWDSEFTERGFLRYGMTGYYNKENQMFYPDDLDMRPFPFCIVEKDIYISKS